MKAIYKHKKTGDLFAIETDADGQFDFRFWIADFGLTKSQPRAAVPLTTVCRAL